MDDAQLLIDLVQIGVIIGEAKKQAIEYRELTASHWGLWGRLPNMKRFGYLGFEVCQARQAGYDAISAGSDGC